MIKFFLSFKKYKIKLILIFLLIISLNLFLLPLNNFKENLAQNLRIYSCQPNLTTFNDNTQFKVKRLYYGFINYVKNGCKYDVIKIDIKLKNFLKINNDRVRSIKNTILTNPQEVPASITYKGKKYKADIRLKGDLAGHWTVNKQWSLRVELKNSESINKMKEFSITKFSERSFPDNLIIANQFKRLGLISPEFKIYKVNINGVNWGLMLAEEQFSDVFLENRKLKDGLIFKLTNEAYFFIKRYLLAKNSPSNEVLKQKQGQIEIDIFNKKKINKFKHLENHETLIRSVNSILNTGYSGNEKYEILNRYFNVKKLARLTANSLVFKTPHTISMSSTRFYLNPYNLKFEPIPTDNRYEKDLKLNNLEEYSNFLSKTFLPFSDIELLEILSKDQLYISEYKIALLDIKSDLVNIKKDINIICERLDNYCKKIIDFKDLEMRILKLIDLGEKVFPKFKNISELNTEIKEISDAEFDVLKNLNTFIYARLFDDYLKVHNLTTDNIMLENVNFYSSKINTKNCKKFKKENCNIETKVLNLNLKRSSDKSLLKKIPIANNNKKIIWAEIKGNIKNKSFKHKIKLENKNFDENSLIEGYASNNKNLKKLNKDTFVIGGKLTINKPIVVPKNHNLKIEPGSELSFAENTYIYLNGGYLFLDGKKKIIKLLPKNKFWGGIYVNNATKKSVMNNTEIIGTKNFEHEGIFLTGGVNFYRSDVEIINSKILNSKCEDALNIIDSNFILNNSLIKDSLSDGLDSDYSKGLIQETSFINIGGDAIDTSGSKVFIRNTKVENVNDKGLSAGEKSEVKIEYLQIDSAKFGLVSKDLSVVKGRDLSISNSIEYDIMAFQKKMHYGSAFINITEVKSNDKILSQVDSEIIINDIKIISKNFNPSKFY